jgi:hypothetical protein
MLDTGGFEDISAQAPVNQPVVLDYGAGSMRAFEQNLLAAQAAIKAGSSTAAEALAAAEEVAAAMRVLAKAGISVPPAAVSGVPTPVRPTAMNPCHHCGQPATAQWQRHATPAEHTQHWDAHEQHRNAIDAEENQNYRADRTDTVTIAVFGCDQHPDPCPGRIHDTDCGAHGACRCGGAE